jgi:hypothetical protein
MLPPVLDVLARLCVRLGAAEQTIHEDALPLGETGHSWPEVYDRQAALALAAARVRSISARARARRSARAASFATFCAASARRARKSEVR